MFGDENCIYVMVIFTDKSRTTNTGNLLIMLRRKIKINIYLF